MTMLVRVKTTCRVLLLADDSQLSAMSLSTLEDTYGSGLLRISELSRSPPPLAGRRLYTNIRQTLQKLWIWALDPVTYPLLLYMDLDVLVAYNLDETFQFNFTTNVAAVPCGGSERNDVIAENKMSRGDGFNAGILLLRPSTQVHRELMVMSRWVKFPWFGFVPRQPKYGGVVSPLTGELQQWYDVCVPAHIAASNDMPTLAAHIGLLGVRNSSDWPLRDCRSFFNGSSVFWRIDKVCASKIGDQSLHNHVLRR